MAELVVLARGSTDSRRSMRPPGTGWFRAGGVIVSPSMSWRRSALRGWALHIEQNGGRAHLARLRREVQERIRHAISDGSGCTTTKHHPDWPVTRDERWKDERRELLGILPDADELRTTAGNTDSETSGQGPGDEKGTL